MGLERDTANLFVLEGVLISLILLGAAYAVRSLPDSSLEEVRPRSELDRLGHDMLVVLDGLDDGNGTTLLERYLTEAFHCAADASPSSLDCETRRSKNLSLKLENYLPLGGGYAVGVGNGFATRELYRSPLPQGEAVSASLTISTEWNTTFVVSELSCYDATDAVNLTLVPVDRGALAPARWGNVTIGSTEYSGVAAYTPRWWNVTLAAGSRPASGTILANVTPTRSASLDGATAYTACDLGGSASLLRDAIRSTSYTSSASSVPIGSSVDLQADLAAIGAVAGLSLTSADITIYEPLPARGATPDTWIESARIPLAGTTVRSATWTPTGSTLYGAHPALLRVGVTISGVSLELRRVIVVDVALPTGEVPIDPPYRAVLQTWLADWG